MLLKYYHIAKSLIDNFECFKMYCIPKESNTRVDLLSKLASTKKVGHLKTIISVKSAIATFSQGSNKPLCET